MEEFEGTWTLNVWKSLKELLEYMDNEGLGELAWFDKHIGILFGSSRKVKGPASECLGTMCGLAVPIALAHAMV